MALTVDEIVGVIGNQYQIQSIILVVFAMILVWKLLEKGGFV